MVILPVLMLSTVVEIVDFPIKIPNKSVDFVLDFAAVPPLPSISIDKAVRSAFQRSIPDDSVDDIVATPPSPLSLSAALVVTLVSSRETPRTFVAVNAWPPFPSISSVPCVSIVLPYSETPFASLSSPSDVPAIPLMITEPCSPVCEIVDWSTLIPSLKLSKFDVPYPLPPVPSRLIVVPASKSAL